MSENTFENHDEAFNYCRDVGHPVIVIIAGERRKLYPSGRALISDGGSPEVWTLEPAVLKDS